MTIIETSAMQERYNFDTWFVHPKLSLKILPAAWKEALHRQVSDLSPGYGARAKFYIGELHQNWLLRYLQQAKIPSIHELLLAGEKLTPERQVWITATFQFKGTSKAVRMYDETREAYHAGYSTVLTRWRNLKISGQFNVEHLHTSTAIGELSGRKQQTVFGYIETVSSTEIRIRTILIGRRFLEVAGGMPYSLQQYLRVDAEEINEFKKIKKISRKSVVRCHVPSDIFLEDQMKEWLQEIIGETRKFEHRPDEKSDVYTRLKVKDRVMTAAMMLKGRSVFEPLTLNNQNKNSDQVQKLFNETAELFVIVHCHHIKQDVIELMESLSSRWHKPARYCIIDGLDLLRIYKAYGKIK
jgi:hypothetical protein